MSVLNPIAWLEKNWLSIVWPAGILVLSLLAGIIIHSILFAVIQRISRKTDKVLFDLLTKHLKGPGKLVLPTMAVHFSLPLLDLSQGVRSFLGHAMSLVLIGAVAWLLTRLASLVEDMILSRYQMEEQDNLRARQIGTQIRVLKRATMFVIGLLAFGAALMTFSQVQQLGTSILASAGIAGIIIGFAAQRSLSTLLAGLQIAFTQPIRLDDVLIVENEWGRVEEITLTYVVIRIWDLRRLVVPITYFLDKPFQNWTRTSADLLGSVYLYVDYSVPVEEIRRELHRIVRDMEQWDGNVCTLQVTNCTERTLELRALVSAANSSDAWNLRCDVRERLLDHIRQQHPEGLPRLRGELDVSQKKGLAP
jgi:small-conductance mechanosensitive channel